MTVAQQARTAGFIASLAVRGVDVSLAAYEGSASDLDVKALIEREPSVVPEQGKQIQRSETVRLHILRSHLSGTSIPVGRSFFTDTKRFRITNVQDNSVDVAVVFECREAATP